MTSIKPSRNSRLQMDLPIPSKRSNFQLSNGTGFSDDDNDDDYEDDFVIEDSSDDDSFEEFLKSKAAKSSDSKVTPQVTSSHSTQPKKSLKNKFLKGLDNDDLGFSFQREKSSSTAQQNLFDSQKSRDSNPLLSLLSERPRSPQSILDRKSALYTSPRDNVKQKKVEFKPEPTVLTPRTKQLNFQQTKDYHVDGNRSIDFAESSPYRTATRHESAALSPLSKFSYLQESKDDYADQNRNLDYPQQSPQYRSDPTVISPRSRQTHFQEGKSDNLDLHRSTDFSQQSRYKPMNRSSEIVNEYNQFQSPRSNGQGLDEFSSKYMGYSVERPEAEPSSKTQLDLLLEKDEPLSKPRSSLNTQNSTVSSRSRKLKSPTFVDQPQLKSIENTDVSKQTSYTDFLSSLPSLDESKTKSELKEQKKQKGKSGKPIPAVRREKKPASPELLEKKDAEDPAGVDGDDLLALFEQVALSDKPTPPTVDDPYPVDMRMRKTMKPSEALAHRMMRQNTGSASRQRSSRQLVDNAIDSVAVHNQTHSYTKEYALNEEDDTEVKRKRSTSKKGSPKKKLPANYKGLGSLTAFQQLRKFSTDSEQIELVSTNDIRSNAYMLWLADREKKIKVKKRDKQREEEKENEKKQKDIKDKLIENECARKAWMNQKESLLEEEEQRLKMERRRRREERMREEEEKWKSAKKAEVARERLLFDARKRHQIDMKTKREEEQIKGQKEKDKRRENKRALAKWNEERGKQWENERKKELREKQIREREKQDFSQRKSEKAKQNFRKWQATKDRQQHYQSGKISYHDEERPPWCPPNKSISRPVSAL